MFVSQSIREDPNDVPGVFAFHILSEVTADDMAGMSEYMNKQFDTHDSVSMLLVFDNYEGSESGALLDREVLKARVRSLSKVDKYAVVGAPERAAKLIETMSAIIPVDARTFDTEQGAWSFLRGEG